MNIYTNSVNEYKCNDFKGSRILKGFQEYYVLALLKFYFPDRFKNAIKDERPDIQSDDFGVEVTIADRENEMKVASDMKKKKIKKGIYNNITVTDSGGIIRSQSGGGFNDEIEKERIKKIIKRKNKSISEYKNKYVGNTELAILFTDIQVSDMYYISKEVAGQFINDEESLIKTIYLIFPDSFVLLEMGRECKGYVIDKDRKERLKKIANLTAKGIIDLESEEWK